MAAVPIKIQGVLAIALTPIYITPDGKRATISLVGYKNPASSAYTITLYRVPNSVPRTLRYSVNLNAGEFMDDESNYELNQGDMLIASCSIDKVEFIINGEESGL